MSQENKGNILGYERLPRLLQKFAVPSIIAMLVSSLYNIVDQIFIGQGVGYLGNAATNVAFPLTTICLAFALLIGIGSASKFSLWLGAGKKEEAARVVANAIIVMVVVGICYMVVIELFLSAAAERFWFHTGSYALRHQLYTDYSSRYAVSNHCQLHEQSGKS